MSPTAPRTLINPSCLAIINGFNCEKISGPLRDHDHCTGVSDSQCKGTMAAKGHFPLASIGVDARRRKALEGVGRMFASIHVDPRRFTSFGGRF